MSKKDLHLSQWIEQTEPLFDLIKCASTLSCYDGYEKELAVLTKRICKIMRKAPLVKGRRQVGTAKWFPTGLCTYTPKMGPEQSVILEPWKVHGNTSISNISSAIRQVLSPIYSTYNVERGFAMFAKDQLRNTLGLQVVRQRDCPNLVDMENILSKLLKHRDEVIKEALFTEVDTGEPFISSVLRKSGQVAGCKQIDKLRYVVSANGYYMTMGSELLAIAKGYVEQVIEKQVERRITFERSDLFLPSLEITDKKMKDVQEILGPLSSLVSPVHRDGLRTHKAKMSLISGKERETIMGVLSLIRILISTFETTSDYHARSVYYRNGLIRTKPEKDY